MGNLVATVAQQTNFSHSKVLIFVIVAWLVKLLLWLQRYVVHVRMGNIAHINLYRIAYHVQRVIIQLLLGQLLVILALLGVTNPHLKLVRVMSVQKVTIALVGLLIAQLAQPVIFNNPVTEEIVMAVPMVNIRAQQVKLHVSFVALVIFLQDLQVAAHLVHQANTNLPVLLHNVQHVLWVITAQEEQLYAYHVLRGSINPQLGLQHAFRYAQACYLLIIYLSKR